MIERKGGRPSIKEGLVHLACGSIIQTMGAYIQPVLPISGNVGNRQTSTNENEDPLGTGVDLYIHSIWMHPEACYRLAIPYPV